MSIGIIADTVEGTLPELMEVIASTSISDFINKNMIFSSSALGLTKDSIELFELVEERAKQIDPQAQCTFVGEDSRERVAALRTGWGVCPHPLLVQDVLAGDSLNYIKLVAKDDLEKPWRDRLRNLSIVPLHTSGIDGRVLYGIVPRRKVAPIVNQLFDVQLFGAPDEPLSTDLFFLKDDLATETGYLSVDGQSASLIEANESSGWIHGATDEGLLVALPGDRSVEEFHFEHARHGHNLKLIPDLSLLEPFGSGPNFREASWLTLGTTEPRLSDDELQIFSKITASEIKSALDRYAGFEPLSDEDNQPVASRHVHSSDNTRTVAQLAKDFQKLGGDNLSVNIHSFTHEGQTLSNVVAELPGDNGREFVLVTAHLDSTAANSPPYEPSNDPAPGADDDASGVAGVLAAAKAILSLSTLQNPKRSFRFVLFNAEEHGLVGSNAYARDAAAAGDGIVAVFQMDMIGYNKVPPRSFEIHVGFRSSSDVEARSKLLAKRIHSLRETVSSNLEAPQIYPGKDGIDPADGRSDHASFQQRGYAACVASEDFFVGPNQNSPAPEDNPNYHKSTDTFVDSEYAADITRVVAAAAWVSARD